ncbi:hypothetical protein [Psychroflexus sp. MBR-150]|jgi:hypothetical protein
MREYKFEFARFQKSPKHKGIYDLIENDLFPFYFVKCSKPKRDYLIENNVEVVIQSWGIEKENKSLHTGLIHVESDFHFGNNINQKGKLDFIIVRFLPEKEQLLFWLFKNLKPRNKSKFSEQFISYLIKSQGVFI